MENYYEDEITNLKPQNMMSIHIEDSCDTFENIKKLVYTIDNKWKGGVFFGALITEMYANSENSIMIPMFHAIHWNAPQTFKVSESSFHSLFPQFYVSFTQSFDLFDGIKAHYFIFDWNETIEENSILTWDMFVYENISTEKMKRLFHTGCRFIYTNEIFYASNVFDEMKQITKEDTFEVTYRDLITETTIDHQYENMMSYNFFYIFDEIHNMYVDDEVDILSKMAYVYMMLSDTICGYICPLFYPMKNIMNKKNHTAECYICCVEHPCEEKYIITRCCDQTICVDCVISIFHKNFLKKKSHAMCPFCRKEWDL